MAFILDSMVVELQAAIGPFQAGLRRASTDLTKWAHDTRDQLKPFEEAALGAAAAATALVAPLAAGTVAFGKFNAVMNSVESKSEATAEQMAKLTDAAIQLGADTQFSALEAAHGFDELTKAGFEVEEQLDSINGVLDLAAAGELAVGEAAEDTAGILRGYNLEAKESVRVADELAQAANTSAVSVRDLAESQKYIAPIAESSNQTLSEMNGILAALGNQMIKGSQAGTSIRAMMIALQKPSDDAAQIMHDLKVSIQDAHGRMLPLSDIIDQLRDKTAKWTETQRSHAMATIFGQESLSAMMALLNMAPGKLHELIVAQEQSTGAAKRMAEGLQKGPNYELEQLKGSIETVAIKFGSTLAPAVSNVIRLFTNLVNVLGSLPAPIRAVTTAVALLAASFLALVAAAGGFVALLPTLVSGIKALGIAWGATLTAMEAILPLVGMLALAFITLAPLIYPIVQAFNEMVSAIDDAASRMNAFVTSSGKLMTDGGAAWRKYQQGIKITADEARNATLYLRQLANEAENPETARRLRERANAMAKVFEGLKKAQGKGMNRGAVVAAPDSGKQTDPLDPVRDAMALDQAKFNAGALSAVELKARLVQHQKAFNKSTIDYWQIAQQIKQLDDKKEDVTGRIRKEHERIMLINERDGGGMAGQISKQEAYVTKLREQAKLRKDDVDLQDELLRAEVELTKLKKQQGDEATRIANESERAARALADANKQAFETLKNLAKGLAGALDTSKIDDLTATLAAQRQIVNDLMANGADPADITRAKGDADSTERQLNREKVNQKGAMPGFVVDNFDAIVNIPNLIVPAANHLATVGASLAQASDGIMGFLGGVWPAIAGAFGQLVSIFSGGFLSGLGSLASGILPAIGGALSGLAAAIAPLLPIIAAVALAFALLQQIWTQNAGGIQEAVGNLMAGLMAVWDGIVAVIQPFVEFFGVMISNVVNQFALLFQVVGMVLQGLGSFLSWLMSLAPIQWIFQGIMWVMNALTDAVLGVVNWFRGLIGKDPITLGKKGDKAETAAAEKKQELKIDPASLPGMAIAVASGIKDVIGSLTSYNPLPVQDVSRANVFGVGPSQRFFVEREVRFAVDLKIDGSMDKAGLLQLAQDRDVKSVFTNLVADEARAKGMIPAF